MIQEVPFGSGLYALTLAFREAHLRRPLGLVQDADDLAGEDTQIHIAALSGDAVLGTVVLKPVSPSLIKLRQMAVAAQAQGTGLGRRLVRFAEGVAVARGFDAIEMSARLSARGFYEALGYRASGTPFIEVTVPHIKMARRLST